MTGPRQLVAAAMLLLLVGCTPQDNAMSPPRESDPWVIRTDFSDDAKWTTIRKLISAPQREAGMTFFAYVNFVSNEMHRDRQPYEVVVSLPDNYPGKFCFVVDRECVEKQEHPVLVVGFYPSDDESFGRLPRNTPAGGIATFRALPSQIQGIENNLSIANMDFEEFAKSVDADGVFRGFPR